MLSWPSSDITLFVIWQSTYKKLSKPLNPKQLDGQGLEYAGSIPKKGISEYDSKLRLLWSTPALPLLLGLLCGNTCYGPIYGSYRFV